MPDIITNDLLPYQIALNALNAYRMSEWTDGRKVWEVILEHDEAVNAIGQLDETERLDWVSRMAAKYGDLVMKDQELSQEYMRLRLAHENAKAPERPKPDEIEKKYFPIAIDEYDYYSKKDEGTVQVSEGEKPSE